MRRPGRPGPSLPEAVLLGLLQGVTEALPLSSSAHLILLEPRVRGSHGPLERRARKTLAVALHAGSAAALGLAFRKEAAELIADRPRLAGLSAAIAPPAVCGVLLERTIEERLGGPRSVALAQLAGGAALLAADGRGGERGHSDARPADMLALGLAQALALLPGVSRAGATMTTARLRGFARPAAARLSRECGLPLLAGVAALRGAQVIAERPSRSEALALGAGAAGALAAGLLSARLAGASRYAPLALYRVGLGALLLARGR